MDKEDPTPKLKSSPIPISFIPFNNEDNECYYCGNKYFKTLLFEQKYCKKCLFRFIKDTAGDHATYLDVHISKYKARCIDHETDICTGNIQEWCEHCSEISFFKQIISPLTFSKFTKICTCEESVYQSKTSYVDFLISSGWVESFLTRKPILILYLPWWDAKDKCIVCKQVLKIVSDYQKSCLHCYTTYIGCRYCLTTNIIFGITDKSQCKKCKRIFSINILNIPNIGSGNYDIDEFLYYTRFNTNNYHAISNYISYYNKNQVWFYNFVEKELVNNIQPIMEWIPYTQIEDFKKLAGGSFDIVYKATWLENNQEVVVKRFFSQDIKIILNELKSFYQCSDKYFVIKYYGITQDPISKHYMLVMDYKNLHNYLRENFTNITWYKKRNILWKISEGLNTIHEKNFIHRDFHSGNIFLSKLHWQIGDANDILLNNKLYGVISYTAPEILKCGKYSKESDIYSMGMIMWELTTGCKPFDNVDNNVTESELIMDIIDGKRPEITNDTPECFSNLMKRCWDSKPTNRPSAKEIYEFFYFWLFRKEYVEQFNEAEKRRLEILELKKLNSEFTKNSYSGPTYTNFSTTLLQSNKLNSLTKRSNSEGYFGKELDFDMDDIQRSLVPHTNITNNSDPTPKLKSSPIPILFIAFNNQSNECINCGNEYFKTHLFEQKYCKSCLSKYVQDITDINTYMDVYIVSKNNTLYIPEISHFKQMVSPFSSPKSIEEKVEESCKLCGNLIYQSMSDFNCIFCSDCYLIFCEWIDSSLTKKPIPILCLPWWDASYDCMICCRYLKFVSDHQKWCSNCFIIYIGCRFCLTTNIIFGITDKSQCKKCKRIIFVTVDIANTTSGNYDIDALLGLDTNKYHMILNYNKYIDNNNDKVLNSLQIYEFIRDKFSDKYNPIVKWFPYSQFVGIKKIAAGGFCNVYRANVVEYGIVAIKLSRKSNHNNDLFNELKSYNRCYNRSDAIIKYLGISQDPETNNYALVMEYADGGDLNMYLKKNFVNISWMDKLIILQNISEGLHAIHKEDIIHRDIHSGNILLKYNDSGNLWKIGDLGLSQPENNTSNNKIYGVIPYIAPEIFNESSFSKAADVYSMGIIMWELTTGCKPFVNVKHDVNLVFKILDGERPEITKDTPEFFANLMKRCWDSNPTHRPTIFEILESVSWYNYGSTTKFAEQFKQAEEIRLELIKTKKLGPEFSEKLPDAIYTSRPLLSCYITMKLEYTSRTLNYFITRKLKKLGSESQNNGKSFYYTRNTPHLNINDQPLSRTSKEIIVENNDNFMDLDYEEIPGQSIIESSSEQTIRRFRLNHGLILTGSIILPSKQAITVKDGELKKILYRGQPLIYMYINSDDYNKDKPLDTCINFPIAEIIYNGNLVESFLKSKDNDEKLNESYGHFLARKFLAGGQLFIKDFNLATSAQIKILKFYFLYVYNSAKRSTKIQFNNLFDLNLLPKIVTMDGVELSTHEKLIKWMNDLYQKKTATIISYNNLISVTQLRHNIMSTDDLESYNEKQPGVANFKERLTLDKWVGDKVHDNLVSWTEDFQLFQGLIINKDYEIKISNKIAVNFIEIPKVNLSEKIYLKKIKPSTNLETILISNNIFSIKNLSTFPFISVNDINAKSYKDYIYFLFKYERYEILLNKDHIKPTGEFKKIIENALSSIEPLKALQNIFNEYGHLFPQRIILGRSLKNILPEKSISFDDNSDMINFNLESPSVLTTSYYDTDIDMVNFNSELTISDYFQNISNISYLLTQEGEVVEKNDIHNWIKNPKNSLEIIEYDDIIPLYKILEVEQQRKIDDILKNDIRIIMTGITDLKDLDNNSIVHYKRINLNPESVLEDEDYEVFGTIISEDNTKLEDVYVNFGLYGFSGFYAIIRKLEETSIDITKLYVIWMIVGNPSKLLILSPNNREFHVDYAKESITLQPDKLNYYVKAPIPLFQGYVISIHAYCSSTNYEPINIIKLVKWNDEFINIQLINNKSNIITFNDTRPDEDNNSSTNIDIDLHICILSRGYKTLKIDNEEREFSLDLFGFILTENFMTLEILILSKEENNNNSSHVKRNSQIDMDIDEY